MNIFNQYLKGGEALDDLGQGLSLIQHSQKYRFTSDAIRLFNFVSIKKCENVCEFGTGSGVISILLASKFKGANFTAFEIQPYMADLARRNVELNSLCSRINIVEGDVRDSKMPKSAFNAVICNPPYEKLSCGDISQSEEIAQSCFELTLNVNTLFESASRALKPKGRFYFCHRASRLSDIFNAALQYGMQIKVIEPLLSGGENIKTLLIMASKGGASGVVLKKPR